MKVITLEASQESGSEAKHTFILKPDGEKSKDHSTADGSEEASPVVSNGEVN